MNPFDFFDNIYYLNLDSRPDREESLLSQAKYLDIHPIRVPALSPKDLGHDNFHLAFNASCWKALDEAVGDNVLILEDDCVFKNIDHLGQALSELPRDYDIVYLGANIIGVDGLNWSDTKPYSTHLHSVKDAWTTHAVGYSRKCIENILETWDYTVFPIFDEHLRVNILPHSRCFIINPMVADQLKGFSDIWQNEVDYGFFEAGNRKMKNENSWHI